MLDKAKITREGSELVLHKPAGPDAIYDAHGNLGTDGIVDADLAPQRAYWETKAVYAPVRILDDRVPFVPGQPSVRIRVRNDYDFTALSTVSIGWKLLRNAEELARGELRASASPHVETTIEIPTARLDALRPGQAGLVELTFTNAAGRELTTRRVQLGELQPEAPRALKVPLRIERDGRAVHVQAGVTRYSFDAETGLVAAIQVAEVLVAKGVQPVVWRPATFSERNQLDRRPAQHPWTTYLQNIPAKAKSWDVTQDAEGVRISAVVEHRQDEKNAVEIAYTYAVLPNGTLRVDYVVTPHVELEWLPEIGLELSTAGALRAMSWLGYGPGDSLPNRRASALFGQWSADAGSPDIAGTKSGIEWAHFDFGVGVRLRVGRVAGVRIDGSTGASQRLRLLSHVAGAWTKNGPAERPEWRLEVKPGETFEGSIEIEPSVALLK
jgi:beta-galactosidase